MPKDTTSPALALSLGQASSAGVKPVNQDFHGALIPSGPVLALKGAVIALADGISTSTHSAAAAQTAVTALLTDYYATPDSWTVRTAASRVIDATNAWLHAQSGYAGTSDADHGYVCTLACLILKARSAHLFHVGDSRIWRLAGGSLEPLTQDHRLALGGESVLSRAMGAQDRVEIDHRVEALRVGDVYLLTTDGVHDHWDARQVAKLLAVSDDLAATARHIVDAALAAGSTDNLTVQILRIDALPPGDATGLEPSPLPIPALPANGGRMDGYTILRSLHGNHRSHLFLALAPDGRKVALKIPASEMRDDPDALRRFAMEEWIARRLSSPHLMSAPEDLTPRNAFYAVTDYIDGQTLRQWMTDHPKPQIEQVRDIVEQVIKGLRALHRREMLHQDLRPENIMIDTNGTVKLIDFGAAYVAGVQEAAPSREEDGILGTYQYTAPEYFANEPVSWRADLYALGVITYEMLTGTLPYGTQVAKVRSPRDRMRLRYRSARTEKNPLPDWLDAALARAVHPDPARRPEALSAFAAELRAPSLTYRARTKPPLIERNPERFWKTTSALLALACASLLITLLNTP
ncbi:bifunctional protein-serine/threonine kinase/phosphatase [Pararhodobacter zhoushanensis]|uniref:bifunctional protein-serine/threonine kinase/phosphatase n=1 Tax=Pararhodobacter zhoushanensis TaxID=2479545 RepID=UPI000F8D1E82|nr:bifunctional protein-serine/threonine kinase/phosphatase [Pararhodobacter zhoushanensis]